MNTQHKWWRWPENKRTGLVPWFVILRRAVVTPLIFFGYALSFVGILIGYGAREALKFLIDVR